MSLVELVSAELKQAMLAKDKLRTTALRSIRAAFIEELKSDGSETLDEGRAYAILRKLAKMRRESIEAYRSGDREDLVAHEAAELDVIEAFLPKLADEAQTRAWVTQAIAESGAANAKEVGKVMAWLGAHHKDELDMKLANQLARTALS